MLRFPHNLSDSQLILLLVIILPVLGILFWLYNAYRMGRLKWKPSGNANPRLISFLILAGILLAAALAAVVG